MEIIVAGLLLALFCAVCMCAWGLLFVLAAIAVNFIAGTSIPLLTAFAVGAIVAPLVRLMLVD